MHPETENALAAAIDGAINDWECHETLASHARWGTLARYIAARLITLGYVR